MEAEKWYCAYCSAEYEVEEEADQCCNFEPDDENYNGGDA